MRADVVASWHRSAAAGVDSDAIEPPITLPDSQLVDYRAEHPLSRVFPMLDDVLGQAARDCDSLMAVSDEVGQLLWVCGSHETLRRAESIGFVEGSNWDERLAGTNAPGLALSLNRPVSVTRTEHFRTSVKGWSCAATPIHDPTSGSLLGVVDITGGDQIVVPQTQAMLKAAARMVEAELAREMALQQAGGVARPAAAGTANGDQPDALLVLEALGRSSALLSIDNAGGAPTRLRLSPRHSEILLLLAATPHGMSGDELAYMLYPEDGGSSTLRAELNRLRQLLGGQLLSSRPYRLTATVTGDWIAVEGALATGELRAAVRDYRGPLLPRSVAPGVNRVRDHLHSALRQAVLASGQADLMSTWTRSSWGADDYEMWLAQQAALTPGSPLTPLVQGQLARLDRELA